MRLPHKALIVTILASLMGGISAAQPTQDMRELAPGASIERELSGGEPHSYRVALSEGQYLRAIVKGHDINILVTLQEPGGAKVFERSRNHRLRPEVILALSRRSGDYN